MDSRTLNAERLVYALYSLSFSFLFTLRLDNSFRSVCQRLLRTRS